MTITLYSVGNFTRSLLFEAYKNRGRTDADKERRLQLAGFVGQLGSATGTVLIFIMTYGFDLLKSAPSCPEDMVASSTPASSDLAMLFRNSTV